MHCDAAAAPTAAYKVAPMSETQRIVRAAGEGGGAVAGGGGHGAQVSSAFFFGREKPEPKGLRLWHVLYPLTHSRILQNLKHHSYFCSTGIVAHD